MIILLVMFFVNIMGASVREKSAESIDFVIVTLRIFNL